MRTVPKWVNKIHEADKIESSSVHAICFNPEGTQLIVGAGEKVMVYDPRDGALVQLLQAHKAAVHAVAYCGDGKKFASGSADKNVIIWTSKMEGVLKYSHSESIQCLAYNPVSLHLASCALSDFAFWSADVKAVQKYRVAGRITSCAWSQNGQFLAIGLAIGAVSLRNKIGDEVQLIQREAPVWAVAFSNSTLLVTDWTDTMSFYNVKGEQVLKDRYIGIAALSITIFDALVLIGGVGGWALLTTEGVVMLNTPQDWVWAVAPSFSQNTIAVACQDGTLWCYQIVFSTVHGLYRERYAYRENITDVIIQHLTTGNKVRIKCHDRVQKIAIYKHRLAVQLPERVVVYEQGDPDGMMYRVKEKLPQKLECSLLIATSDALLLCQDNKLSMIGKRSPRSWSFPAPIRYVKVTTLYFMEVLLLGLLNGQIWQVEPKDGTSKVIVTIPSGVRCLDVSASRSRLAVVDDLSVCRVYCLPTVELLYSEENVSSVSWNSLCDELLCLSGGGLLSIKAGKFPAATQPLAGSVVGFQGRLTPDAKVLVQLTRILSAAVGSLRPHPPPALITPSYLTVYLQHDPTPQYGGRVFCLQASAMQTIKVPLSHAVHQYVQKKMFNDAYAVACLGVTALDWERLGMMAFDELAFEVARKAFQRSENISYLTLIDQLQERLDAGEKRGVVEGEVLAYRGKYNEAANSFQTSGRDDRALNLYLDLRMFNKAQELVGEGEGVAAVGRRRAEWARHVSEPRAAAEMYLAVGDVRRAAQLMADNGRRDMLIELARKVDKGSSESLRHVAEALVTVGEPAAAADVYQRLGDYRKVAQLAISACEWQRAFALAREHAECRSEVYLPYANRMAQENKFIEAQKAYHMAGETVTAMRVFTVLVGNAVAEERFSDAGYLHHLLALQYLETANTTNDKDHESALRSYEYNAGLSAVYNAYEAVHRCIHEPFSLTQPDTLLNAARYAHAYVDDNVPPPGISLFCLYLCIAKQAKTLNANALAQQMLDKILNLQVPQKFQESVELLILKSRATSCGDNDEEVAPLCWRCRRHVPVLCATRCPHCSHQLTHSVATYEVLPLVQFIPAEGISMEEAFELLERTPLPEATTKETNETDILRIDHDIDSSDPFLDKIEEDDESGVVVCSRNALLRMNPGSVVTVQRPPLPTRFYRNMLPELPISCCSHCQHLFYMEDYEIQIVTKGHCPFCRHPPEEINEEVDDSLLNGSDASTPDSASNGHTWR